jgi:hypothetical protein
VPFVIVDASIAVLYERVTPAQIKTRKALSATEYRIQMRQQRRNESDVASLSDAAFDRDRR